MFYQLFCLLIIALAGLLTTGCESFLPGHKSVPGPSAIDVYQARREAPPPIEPALSVMPRAPINEPQPATIAQTPMPVWNDAQVVKVDLDAYVNEKGEAFGPSVKYVVKQPGGWNVDALRNPVRSYVPTENTPPIPSKSGYTSNPLISPGSAPEPGAGQVRPLQASMIENLGNVRVTGFVERSQESMARSMAQYGEVPLFDESLGWILVPAAALVPANQMPDAMPMCPTQQVQYAAPQYAPAQYAAPQTQMAPQQQVAQPAMTAYPPQSSPQMLAQPQPVQPQAPVNYPVNIVTQPR